MSLGIPTRISILQANAGVGALWGFVRHCELRAVPGLGFGQPWPRATEARSLARGDWNVQRAHRAFCVKARRDWSALRAH